MVRGKKGQIIFEFMFWVAISIFFGGILLLLMSGTLNDQITKQKEVELRLQAESIQHELILASEMNNGYRRAVYVSENDDYNLSLSKSYLVLSMDKRSVTLRVPPTSGVLVKGDNIIENVQGDVQIN